MSASLAGVYNFQAFKSTGDLAASYRLYTYSPSTTTKKVAYTEQTGSTPHTYTADGGGGEYIAVNARGELPAPLFLTSGGYDLCLKTDAGVTIWTRRAYGTDEASGALKANLADTTSATTGAGMVGFDVDMAYAAFTIGSAIKDLGVSALWYMSAAQRSSVLAGDLTQDVTTPVQAAITAAYGRSLYMPGRYKITSGLTVTGRIKIYGDHPVSSEIVYRTATTTANQLFDFDNVDNILIEDLALTNSASSGGQTTTAIQCQGDLGSVTEIKLRNVYIDGFMKYGIKFHSGALYITLDGVRILNCTNDVSAGGSGVGNAVALYFGTTVNALTITRSRISANDEAINGDTTAKYCLSIRDTAFEVNGETGTPGDTITLYNWHGVAFSGNYCEANKTGSAADDSFLRLQACAAVKIEGGLINGSSGGTGKSKNLIGISDTCVGVTIDNVELQDPITKLVYVADGNSLTKLTRNRYQYGGVYITAYDDIMARMTAALVELDVAYPAAVTTGVIAAGNSYQANFTVLGVDVTRNAAILATPINGGSDFIWSCAAISADTVRVMAYNIKGVNNSFTGTVVIRVLKDG